MIIQKKKLKNTLFLDIETVSATRTFYDLKEEMQALWKRKCLSFVVDKSVEITDDAAHNFYIQKAGIFAEFAKVACISIGYLTGEKKTVTLRVKSYDGQELDILEQFSSLLDAHYDDPDNDFLCGHNIKEFDIPFLCRRMVVNDIHLPKLLNIAGKKPWQVDYLLDTMDLWRFGDYKNYTSLALLAGALGIPSPKDDIDGSMVGHVYWEDDNIDRIVTYCEKDVVTVAQIALKMAGATMLDEENIIFPEK